MFSQFAHDNNGVCAFVSLRPKNAVYFLAHCELIAEFCNVPERCRYFLCKAIVFHVITAGQIYASSYPATVIKCLRLVLDYRIYRILLKMIRQRRVQSRATFQRELTLKEKEDVEIQKDWFLRVRFIRPCFLGTKAWSS